MNPARNSGDVLNQERHIRRLESISWKYHVGFGLAVLFLGLIMIVKPDETVAFVFLPEYSFPNICLVRKYFQVDCVTCGMTRSIVLLLHGQWDQAHAQHSLGWLVLLIILGQIPYGIQLWYRGSAAWRPERKPALYFWCTLIATLVVARFWR